MSLKLDGTGKITGIDQGLSVVGVGTFSTDLDIGGDVVVGGGLTVTGVLTYEDVTNVDSIGIITARSGIVGDLTGNVTGDITGNIIGSPTLSGISSSITDTAVDIFVYDTSKDSDGGAWRKRTQHTSWYNETLNTSTRGSRKEFPAVAVIVAESNQVTIYDGDDPDLPMWMVFNQGGAYVASNNLIGTTAGTNSAISSLNGILSLTTGNEALYLIKFISDTSQRITNSADREYLGGIGERNSGKGLSASNSTNYIVNANCNDVAMTVLPNAPIDETTGLPVPTIAVATDGGYSIIKDDGTVVDGISSQSNHNKVEKITFTDNNQVAYVGFDYNLQERARFIRVDDLISADTTITTSVDQTQNSSALYGYSTGFAGNLKLNIPTTNYVGESFIEGKDGNIMFGNVQNLFLINENVESPSSGMHAGIATDFNTGWMHGDIKGAFLSDTDDTNAAPGSNLIPVSSADFSSSTGWTLGTGWTISGGKLNKTTTDNVTASYSATGLTIGKAYTFSIDVDTVGSGTLYFYALGQYTIWPSLTTTGTHSLTVVANATSLDFGITAISGNGAVLDNASLTVGEADRSVNNKGLQVFGTITKSAVATGADLVAYSGNGTSSYLEQSYNSDLDFGANSDFSVTGWMYNTYVGGGQYIFDRSVTYNSSRDWQIWVAADLKYMSMYIDGGQAVVTPNDSFPNDAWFHFAVLRSGDVARIYINGVEKVSTASTLSTIPASNAPMKVLYDCNQATKLALLRISASAPSAAQVKKMYEDEKFLFQENAKCTLYGSSDAVTALAYDEVTEQLHVGTSSGRSDFQGLRRINNTTTAVTTAISAHDEFIAEQ